MSDAVALPSQEKLYNRVFYSLVALGLGLSTLVATLMISSAPDISVETISIGAILFCVGFAPQTLPFAILLLVALSRRTAGKRKSYKLEAVAAIFASALSIYCLFVTLGTVARVL